MINTSRNTLSANWVLRFVPADVWRFIFQINSSAILSTLRVSQVCSSWRSITDNAPELWTNIVLYYTREEGHVTPDADFFSYLLAKSRNMPLTMGLLASERIAFDGGNTAKVLEVFLRSMHRAQRLKLDIDVLNDCLDQLDQIDHLMALVRPGLALEEIEIDVGDEALDDKRCLPSDVWKPAPLLRALSMDGPAIAKGDLETLHDASFPFQQLTSLEVKCPIFDDGLILLLSLTPLLVQAKFHSIRRVKDDLDIQIQMLKLRSLTLGEPSYTEDSTRDTLPVTDILRYIAAPNLTTLRLSFNADWSLEILTSFIKASSRIQNLHFDILNATDTDRIECLKLLPSLRILNLSFTAGHERDFDETSLIGRDFLDAMMERNVSSNQLVLCPNLERLIVDYDTFADTTTSAFADMIQRRWKHSATDKEGKFELVIKEVGWLGDCPESVSELHHLLLLRKTGLKLLIESKSSLEEIFDTDLL
ncbi:hypothetical protein CVT26_015557 [Gymnopilus dilepis]|uniref:F-box domain-containing protein n=1 Tax=Gymnopilus dilepis TaxID=231916 RepID=A0A409YDA7_9AGAR|nr:hypothetical protein CVT26_015557 [Gymnopilus dilepis]